MVIAARKKFNSKMLDLGFSDRSYDCFDLILAAFKGKQELFKTKLSVRAIRCVTLASEMA